jgi:hypothetical protein
MASERLSPAMRRRLVEIAGDWYAPRQRPRTDRALRRRGLIRLAVEHPYWELTPAGRALLEGGD